MTFQVVKCPKCAKLQLTTATRTLGCKYCGAKSTLAGISVLFSSASHQEALRSLYSMQPALGSARVASRSGK